MLLSAKIVRFRTCRDVTLTAIQDPAVLLGRNGAGKTNILHAILWIARFGSPQMTDEEMELDGYVELRLKLGKHRYTYSLHRYIDFDEPRSRAELVVEETLIRHAVHDREAPDGIREPLLVLIDRNRSTAVLHGQDTITVNENTSALSLAFAIAKPGSESSREFARIIDFLSGINYYPLLPHTDNSGTRYYQHKEYEAWKKGGPRSPKSSSDLSLTLIDAWLTNRDKFQEIASLVGPDGLEVIDGMYVLEMPFPSSPNAEESHAPQLLYTVMFTPANSNPHTHGSHLSHLAMGTRKVIQLITHIVMDKITVALLEQPEDALHPALLRKLMSVIETYSHDFQFILTSHSVDVFNCVSPGQVKMVNLEDGVTRVGGLTRDQKKSAIQYMQDDGSFSDFLELL